MHDILQDAYPTALKIAYHYEYVCLVPSMTIKPQRSIAYAIPSIYWLDAAHPTDPIEHVFSFRHARRESATCSPSPVSVPPVL
jgi:hypothetical protein